MARPDWPWEDRLPGLNPQSSLRGCYLSKHLLWIRHVCNSNDRQLGMKRIAVGYSEPLDLDLDPRALRCREAPALHPETFGRQCQQHLDLEHVGLIPNPGPRPQVIHDSWEYEDSPPKPQTPTP